MKDKFQDFICSLEMYCADGVRPLKQGWYQDLHDRGQEPHLGPGPCNLKAGKQGQQVAESMLKAKFSALQVPINLGFLLKKFEKVWVIVKTI